MYISASAPDAPPLSDTTIGCFIRLFFWIAACIIRAIWSEAPPAPAATTISTGLVGSQAAAVPARANTASALAAMRICIFIVILLRVLGVWLGDLACGRLSTLRKIVHCGTHAFLLHRHAGEREAHFDAGERAH